MTKSASARSASRFVPSNVRDFQTFLPVSGSRPAYTRSTHSPVGSPVHAPRRRASCYLTRPADVMGCSRVVTNYGGRLRSLGADAHSRTRDPNLGKAVK